MRVGAVNLILPRPTCGVLLAAGTKLKVVGGVLLAAGTKLKVVGGVRVEVDHGAD